MSNKLTEMYTQFYLQNGDDKVYPNEYVIRIFKGNYPHLHLAEDKFLSKNICDIGCGDGRNMILLHDLGFNVFGSEISPDIVMNAKNKLAQLNISADVQVGRNHDLSFDNEFFDYLLSWNSCYYMGVEDNFFDFQDYLKEFSRVLKDNGKLIFSIPMLSHYIFSDSEDLGNGYRILKNDPHNIRNDDVFMAFNDENDIEAQFSKYFHNFSFGTIKDNCFGLNNHWYIGVCEKLD